MSHSEKRISPLIQYQFPEIYREEGPQFVQFVKHYYEWLEQPGNVLDQTRSLLDFRDIDKTVEDFVVYFKEENLKNIQFNVKSNKRLFVKNALDFYRSKGTPRNIDLFFRLIYGSPANVYYPGDDLFKLSDSKFKVPTYLELSQNNLNASFEGKAIRGLRSGATAFAERFAIRKIVDNSFDESGNPVQVSRNVPLLFITNVKGKFEFDEVVVYDGIDNSLAPVVTGSLTDLTVLLGANDYKVGDIVALTSNNGKAGKGVVRAVTDASGQVTFTLENGGWGYTEQSQILISDYTWTLTRITPVFDEIDTEFIPFERIIQPLANLNYTTVSGAITEGDIFNLYDAEPKKQGEAKVITFDGTQLYTSILPYNKVAITGITRTLGTGIESIVGTNVVTVEANTGIQVGDKIKIIDATDTSFNGEFEIEIVNGNTFTFTQYYESAASGVSANLVYIPSIPHLLSETAIANNDATSLTISSGSDLTAWANLIGTSVESIFFVEDLQDNISFQLNETIYQGTSDNKTAEGKISIVTNLSGIQKLEVTDILGVFYNDERVYGLTSNANAAITYYNLNVGSVDSSYGQIASITIDNGGSDYANNELIYFNATTGFGGVAYIRTNGSGTITDINLINSGKGYSSDITAYIPEDDIVLGIDQTNVGTNVINATHEFTDADLVTLSIASGTITGLTSGNYYIRQSTATSFALSNNPFGTIIEFSTTQNISATFTRAGSGGTLAEFTVNLGKPLESEKQEIYVYGSESKTYGEITNYGSGSLASFKITSFDDEENVFLGLDRLGGTNFYNAPWTFVYLLPNTTEGNLQDISAMSGDGSNTTIQTTLNHGYSAGANVYISGTFNGMFDFTTGYYTISEVPSANTFVVDDDATGTLISSDETVKFFNPDSALTGDNSYGFPKLLIGDIYNKGPSITFLQSNVDVSNDYIDFGSAHGYSNGDIVAYSPSNADNFDQSNYYDNTRFFGLQPNRGYYAIKVDNNKLAFSTAYDPEDITFSILAANKVDLDWNGVTPNSSTFEIYKIEYVIDDMLDTDSFALAAVSGIGSFNPGEDYNIPPIVAIFEPISYATGFQDYNFTFDNSTPTTQLVAGERLLYSLQTTFNANTDVAASYIFVEDSIFNVGDKVVYRRGSTGTTVSLSGLVDGGEYYIRTFESTGNKLSLSADSDLISIVNVAASGTEAGDDNHILERASKSTIGIIREILGTYNLIATRASVYNPANFVGNYLTGETSQAQLLVSRIDDFGSRMGLNAIIDASADSSIGSVKTIDVIDSGFGYIDREIVSFQKLNDATSTVGLAQVALLNEGKGEGFNTDTKSQLSYDKMIYDGYYYQDYSYEVQSPISIDKYEEMLKRVAHVAGTQLFGKVVSENKIDSLTTINEGAEYKMVFDANSALIISEANDTFTIYIPDATNPTSEVQTFDGTITFATENEITSSNDLTMFKNGDTIKITGSTGTTNDVSAKVIYVADESPYKIQFEGTPFTASGLDNNTITFTAYRTNSPNVIKEGDKLRYDANGLNTVGELVDGGIYYAANVSYNTPAPIYNISSITEDAGVATVDLNGTNHGYIVGMKIQIGGTNDFDGTYPITSIPAADQFTFSTTIENSDTTGTVQSTTFQATFQVKERFYPSAVESGFIKGNMRKTSFEDNDEITFVNDNFDDVLDVAEYTTYHIVNTHTGDISATVSNGGSYYDSTANNELVIEGTGTYASATFANTSEGVIDTVTITTSNNYNSVPKIIINDEAQASVLSSLKPQAYGASFDVEVYNGFNIAASGGGDAIDFSLGSDINIELIRFEKTIPLTWNTQQPSANQYFIKL